jgi:hypothetical protein
MTELLIKFGKRINWDTETLIFTDDALVWGKLKVTPIIVEYGLKIKVVD